MHTHTQNNMYYTRVLLLLTIFLGETLPAQTLFHSHGTLPAGLVGKPEDRAKKQIDARKAQGDLLDEAESAFIYLTEYSFASFAASGRLSTGDSVSNYAERILDKLLAKDPKLRKKITIYTLRSTEVNYLMRKNKSQLRFVFDMRHKSGAQQQRTVSHHKRIHFC